MADLAMLKATIENIDAFSQDGFSEISTIANMALTLMETEPLSLCPESLARILRTIRAKAVDTMNLINSEAEEVGCNFTDEAAVRRHEARRSAENRRKECCHG